MQTVSRYYSNAFTGEITRVRITLFLRSSNDTCPAKSLFLWDKTKLLSDLMNDAICVLVKNVRIRSGICRQKKGGHEYFNTPHTRWIFSMFYHLLFTSIENCFGVQQIRIYLSIFGVKGSKVLDEYWLFVGRYFRWFDYQYVWIIVLYWSSGTTET